MGYLLDTFFQIDLFMPPVTHHLTTYANNESGLLEAGASPAHSAYVIFGASRVTESVRQSSVLPVQLFKDELLRHNRDFI